MWPNTFFYCLNLLKLTKNDLQQHLHQVITGSNTRLQKETKNAIFTGPFPGTVSVDSIHMVCHIISSAGGTHPSHPAGTDLSICLPCLVMVFINKYSSKERRPAKLFTRDLFTFALSILIGFLWSKILLPSLEAWLPVSESNMFEFPRGVSDAPSCLLLR